MLEDNQLSYLNLNSNECTLQHAMHAFYRNSNLIRLFIHITKGKKKAQ